MKIAKLKKVEQESRIIEEFVQKFRKAVRVSRYKERLLIEKFKKGMNSVIRQKLIKVECSPKNIKQQYKRAMNLDRHWRESRKEKKRLKERRKIRSQTLRINMLVNVEKV